MRIQAKGTRPRLIFIDDDETELAAFRGIAGKDYEVTTIHWPRQAETLGRLAAPDIYVCDLHLPDQKGDATPSPRQRAKARNAARQVGQGFLRLYDDAVPGKTTILREKARLKRTMAATVAAFRLLSLQRSALGQSASHGIALLGEIRRRHRDVPFVFYSRKITPEEVIRVLKAGATDAIRKGALNPEEILERLAAVLRSWETVEFHELGVRGLNRNVTLFS
jgi:DNA-binding response OmpR family regulator